MGLGMRRAVLPFIAAERPFVWQDEPVTAFRLPAPRDRRSVSTTLNVGELLNLVGLSTGVVLYAMLLAMVVRAARTPGLKSGFDPLLLLTSLLGLVWNLCALPAYELPKMGIEGPFPSLAAVGFAALGFLPAVVVHSVLRDEHQTVRGAVKSALAVIAYAVSGLAALLHISAAWTEAPVPAPLGMRLLTYSFVALAIPLAAVTRRRAGAGRALWAAALAIFAVSALHLSQLHRGEASWPVELVGHHASLPLAFAILYQDYRFAFADLFLKRAMALLAIVAVAFAAIATFGVRSAAFAQFVQANPRQMTVLVTLWVATALLYPLLRRATTWFVDTIVLHRPDYPSLRAAIARASQNCDTVPTLLSMVSEQLGPALNATFVTWREWTSSPQDGALGAVVIGGNESAAFVDAAAGDPLPGATGHVGHDTDGRSATFRPRHRPIERRPPALVGRSRHVGSDRRGRGASHRRHSDHDRAVRPGTSRTGNQQAGDRSRAARAPSSTQSALSVQCTDNDWIPDPDGASARVGDADAADGIAAGRAPIRRRIHDARTRAGHRRVVPRYREGALRASPARHHRRPGEPAEHPASAPSCSSRWWKTQSSMGSRTSKAVAMSPFAREPNASTTSQRQLAITVEDTGAGATSQSLQRGRSTGLGLRNVERRLECQYGTSASLSIRTAPGEGTIVEIRLPAAVKAADDDGVRRVAS